MKVRELMEYLNKFPEDATVMCFEPENGEYMMIDIVKPATSLAMKGRVTTGLIIRRVF